MMKKFAVLFALLLVLVGAVVPASAQGGTIADVVVASTQASPAEFTTLLAAVQAADPGILAALADPAGNLTVFAPTDAAFGGLLSRLNTTAADLLGNQALLNDVLKYHVLPGRFDAATLVGNAQAGRVLHTLQGERLLFNLTQQGALRINASNVLAADIAASNGIIHVIDRVLLPSDVAPPPPPPPSPTPALQPTIAEIVVASTQGNPAQFTVLLAAVQAADPAVLAAISDRSANLTVFAPTDAAFGELLMRLNTSAADLLANRALVTQVLLYHVLSGRFDAAALIGNAQAGQTLNTLEGTRLLFNLTQQGALRINASNVIAANIGAANGIVHVIDRVLLPSDVLPPPTPSPTPAPQPTIAEIVVAATQANPAEFTILLAAVQAADPAVLAAISDRSANLTVFAPTDAAFGELLTRLNTSAADLLANRALLTQVLLYHVLPGRFDAAALIGNAQVGRTLNTLEGTRLLFNLTQQGALRINASNVVSANIGAANGIVHVIDRVLLPSDVLPPPTPTPTPAPQPTIAEIVVAATQANPAEFTILLAAVQAADPAVLAALSDRNANLTVFAPTDRAFRNLLRRLNLTAGQLLGNRALVTQVLLYHVLPGRFDAAALVANARAGRTLNTLEGTRLLFNLTRQGALRINASNVVSANIGAANGIVHVIDRVLLPSDVRR
jgi:transforming growth factor-beta-induced protein